MKKILKKILVCILITCFINILMNKVYAGYQKLNSLHFDIEINKNGTVHIEEIWDITATQTNTLFKDFDLGINSNEKYEFKNVEVYDYAKMKKYKDVKEEQYHVEENGYYGLQIKPEVFEIAWNIGADNETKSEMYKVSYDIENIIQNGEDFSQLYLQLISDANGIPVEKITATINLPQSMERETECKVWGHGPLNATIFQKTDTKIEVDGENLDAGEMFEIRIVMPEGIFTNDNKIESILLEDIVREETNWANEANETRKEIDENKISTVDVIKVILVLASIFSGYCIIKNLEKYKKSKNERFEEYSEYYRDIPDENTTPGECLYLLNDIIFYEQSSAILMANILNFYTKGMLELYEENENIIIEINKEKFTSFGLKKEEMLIAEIITGATRFSKKITFNALSNYIKEHAKKCVYNLEYIPKAVINEEIAKGNLDSSKLSTISIGAMSTILMIIFLIPGIAQLLISYNEVVPVALIFLTILIINAFIKGKIRKLEKYTVQGYKEKLKWKGLKRYLLEYSRLKDRETMDITLWEKYLVYATAMGISSKVVDELKIAYPEMYENMYEHSKMMHMLDTRSFSKEIYRTTSNLRKSYSIAHPSDTSSSSTFSSGSGGGGGFSSGGGGRISRTEAWEEGKKIYTIEKKRKKEKNEEKVLIL